MAKLTEESWGELPPVEGTTQVTRSMLEMLNPKPYVNETEPNLVSIQAPETKPRKCPKCPYVSHSIHLLSYISEVESFIQEVSATKNKHVIMPKLPEFKRFSVETGEEQERNRNDNFEYGTNIQTVKALTRRGVATLALQYECEKSTNSVLDFLTDLTLQWIETVTKSLRLILDNEALTGKY
uniref:Uncharacterized protein LOC100177564 n=1 Tax=Phallusia mammillata TaxID=59560 RepID=A0A6F9DG59_9ASCI|nr:uncharacterized protein LOC100177564 [Phallusia mammillata]